MIIQPTKVNLGTLAPPGNTTDEYTIWESGASAAGKGFIQKCGIERVTLVIGCSGAGTLRAYYRENAGSYVKYYELAVSADDGPWTTDIPSDHDFDFYVGRFDDFSLRWVNAAPVAQTVWSLDLKLHYDRAVPV